MWLKAVPLKVSIFVWRLFLNRIPTRDKLFQRRVLAESDQSCVANCGLNEDINHLFLNCGFLWRYPTAYCGLVRIFNIFAWLFSESLSSVWWVAWLFKKVNCNGGARNFIEPGQSFDRKFTCDIIYKWS